MRLIWPDILEQAKGLSVTLCLIGLLAGLALWLLGWWGHRFWVVLLTTVIAGISGLGVAPSFGAQPLLAGFLFALGAGIMALDLVRLVAFVAGGLTACLIVQALIPTWDDSLLSFLTGGLLGVALFRIWTMLLTSLGGIVLATYSGLCLLDTLGNINAATWAQREATLLNAVCGALTIVGLIFQLALDRRLAGKKGKKSSSKSASPGKPEKKPDEAEVAKAFSWWKWAQAPFRRAG
jgi:MFS family permease